MDNPAITYDELKAALEEDSCARITEPALFALLDKLDQAPSLFGRWATHPEYGRGIIVSIKPDGDGEVGLAYRNGSYSDGVDTRSVYPERLTFDPVTLATTEEFKSAPIGTIIECTNGDAFAKDKEGLWNDEFNDKNMNNYYAPARVIRWGDGK